MLENFNQHLSAKFLTINNNAPSAVNQIFTASNDTSAQWLCDHLLISNRYKGEN